jgi:hypothetical protein
MKVYIHISGLSQASLFPKGSYELNSLTGDPEKLKQP